MRRLFVALFILLHRTIATAGGVVVQPQHTTLVPTTQQLFDMCSTSGTYDACTRFVAYRLEATCSRTTDSWRINAAATFQPWVLLRNIEHLAHEQDHIRDVRLSLERYVADLEASSFDTREACEQRALLEAGAFAGRVRESARESNLARHPQLKRLAAYEAAHDRNSSSGQK